MAYTRTTLISSPVESSYGIVEALGGLLDDLASGAKSVVSSYGAGVRAQGAAAALKEIELEKARAGKASPAAVKRIPTTYLVAGGVAAAALLVFAMRRK